MGLTMERSLQGLPPMSKSNGPHRSIWVVKEEQGAGSVQRGANRYFSSIFKWLETFSAKSTEELRKDIKVCVWTYMFLGDEPGITYVDDLPIVVDGRHRNRILAHLWGHIFLHFEAKVLQHQVALRTHKHSMIIVIICKVRTEVTTSEHPLINLWLTQSGKVNWWL